MVHCSSLYPVSILNLAVALTYLITVLTASNSGCHAAVSLTDLAPVKNLISPSLLGHLSYILFHCVTHLMQLKRKCYSDLGAAPH